MEKKTNQQLETAIEALFGGEPVDTVAAEAGENEALDERASPAPSLLTSMNDASLRAHAARLSVGGDPDEALVRTLALLAERPDDAGLLEEERELLEWLGDDLAVLVRNEEGSLTWRDGLLDTVMIGDVESCDDAAANLAMIVDAPAARFLSELILWGVLERVPAEIARCGVPSTLSELTLVAADPLEWHATMNILRYVGAAPELPAGPAAVPGALGSLHVAYGRLRHLQKLVLYAGRIDFGEVDLPSLCTAELHTDFTSENLASIGRAVWPKLSRLELRFGASVARGGFDVVDDEEDLGCVACTPDDLALILEGKGLVELEVLGLVGLSFADAVAARLQRAPLLERLVELDLSKGRMTDAGAQHLLAARRELSHLERLDLSENFISDDAAALLTEAFPNAIVDPQRVPMEE